MNCASCRTRGVTLAHVRGCAPDCKHTLPSTTCFYCQQRRRKPWAGGHVRYTILDPRADEHYGWCWVCKEDFRLGETIWKRKGIGSTWMHRECLVNIGDLLAEDDWRDQDAMSGWVDPTVQEIVDDADEALIRQFMEQAIAIEQETTLALLRVVIEDLPELLPELIWETVHMDGQIMLDLFDTAIEEDESWDERFQNEWFDNLAAADGEPLQGLEQGVDYPWSW